MIIDKKRVPNIEARKYKGGSLYVLLYTRHQSPGYGRWLLPLEHGGQLATNLGDQFYERTRAVSWRKLPPEIQVQVKTVVDHLRRYGDPIDNDESVFTNPKREDPEVKRHRLTIALSVPHGHCTGSRYCLEHEQDPRVEACR